MSRKMARKNSRFDWEWGDHRTVSGSWEFDGRGVTLTLGVADTSAQRRP